MAVKTPDHIEILVHYYSSSSDHPRISSPAVKEIVKELLDDGIFEDVSDFTLEKINSPSFKLTEKGVAWLFMLLDTPYPVSRTIWLDQKGKPINTKREFAQTSNVTRFPEAEAQYKLGG